MECVRDACLLLADRALWSSLHSPVVLARLFPFYNSSMANAQQYVPMVVHVRLEFHFHSQQLGAGKSPPNLLFIRPQRDH